MEPLDNSWSILGLDERQDLLEAIFRVSDLSSLKNFRLVSHLWNKEVLRVLEEKSYIQTRKGSLVFLLSTLKSCPAPQCFFTSLEIHFSDSGFNNVALQEILENYGHHLKSLRLSGDIKQDNILLRIMMGMDGADDPNNVIVFNPPHNIAHIQKNIKMTSKLLRVWCPNLLSVRLFTSFHVTDCVIPRTTRVESAVALNCHHNNGAENPAAAATMSSTTINNLLNTPCLRLTTIELDGYMISSLRSYCIQLLQLCPDLIKLKISFGTKLKVGVWEILTTAPLFFTELQKRAPQVTRRLQQFTVLGLKVPGLTDAISELEFSPDKLRSLGISGSTNVSDPEFPKFVEFLEKLVNFPNMERLTIVKCSCSSCEWRNWREKARWRDIEQSIPTLKSVRHLDIASNGTHGIASLSLLNKFPNLHTLEFSRLRVGHPNPDHHRDNVGEFVDFDYFFSDWIYLKLTAKYGNLLISNCANVKNLTIHHTIFKLESIQCIKECFPNLSRLSISIRSAVQYCWEVYMQCKLSLSSCLEILSTLPNLVELYIMMPVGVIYPKQEISRALKMLRGFPELRRFNLSLGSPEYSQKAPFRCRDASDPSIKELFSEFILNREVHLFRSLTMTFVGVCCCNVTKEELDDIRNVLTSYRHSYRFNWCCHQSARIFARYGNKRYEYSPANESNKKEEDVVEAEAFPTGIIGAQHSECESRHWSSDIEINA